MCSACMTNSPSGVKSAAEQSRRSLMFGEWAERMSTAPISSQIDRSRPTRTPSAIGSRPLMVRSFPLGDDGSVLVNLGRPPRRQDERRLRQLEERGALERLARGGLPARDGGVQPLVAEVDLSGVALERGAVCRLELGLRRLLGQGEPDRDELDRRVGHVEPVAPLVGFGEAASQLVRIRRGARFDVELE